MMKKHIPNLITLGNLFSGTVATIFAVNADFKTAAYFVAFGIFLDFFDGFFARLLNVQGELGKQLDSLADMVTSGVAPGVVMMGLIRQNLVHDEANYTIYLSYFGLLLTLGACYRLANFNIDTRQSDSFIGVPTPAMSLFVVFLPFFVQDSSEIVKSLVYNPYVLFSITILFTYLMNCELPLFSLKFKNFSFKNNVLTYTFLAISVLMLTFFKLGAIPFIILLYIVLSLIIHLKNRKEKFTK